MNIIQIIVMVLISLLIINAVAWGMIWNKVDQVQEMLEDDAEARRVVRDAKFFDEDK